MKDYVYTSVFKKEFADFLKLRKAQGLDDKNSYVLQSLDRYLSEHSVTSKELSPIVIDGWLSENSQNRSDNTLGHYVSYATVFGKHLITLGFDAFIPEYRGYTKTYVPYIFSTDEVETIFRIADNRQTKNDKLTRIQFPMLLRILYGCGLRLGEALKLRLADIDFKNGVIIIWHGKNNRDRLVPMEETLINILRVYCDFALAGKPMNAYLFESDYKDGKRNCIGNPRYPSWAQNNFQRILKEMGIEVTKHSPNERGACLHCIRHTFSVNSLRKQDLAGIDSYSAAPLLSIYLGHTKLAVTQRYLHMTAENSEDILSVTAGYTKGLFPEVPQ